MNHDKLCFHVVFAKSNRFQAFGLIVFMSKVFPLKTQPITQGSGFDPQYFQYMNNEIWVCLILLSAGVQACVGGVWEHL